MEQYLKRMRFSSPGPELREQILQKAAAEWSISREPVKHPRLNIYWLSIHSWLHSLRLKPALASAFFAVMLFAMFFHYGNYVISRIDMARHFLSNRSFSSMINSRAENLTFSYEDWYRKNEIAKIIKNSIHKRFSLSENNCYLDSEE